MVHTDPYVPTFGFPLNLLPIDFHSPWNQNPHGPHTWAQNCSCFGQTITPHPLSIIENHVSPHLGFSNSVCFFNKLVGRSSYHYNYLKNCCSRDKDIFSFFGPEAILQIQSSPKRSEPIWAKVTSQNFQEPIEVKSSISEFFNYPTVFVKALGVKSNLAPNWSRLSIPGKNVRGGEFPVIPLSPGSDIIQVLLVLCKYLVVFLRAKILYRIYFHFQGFTKFIYACIEPKYKQDNVFSLCFLPQNSSTNYEMLNYEPLQIYRTCFWEFAPDTGNCFQRLLPNFFLYFLFYI